MQGKDLIYKDESFNIIGLCMRVHSELGIGFHEIVYKDALETELKLHEIPYKREAPLPIFYKNILLRTFNVDFVVYDKILIEAKATSNFTEDNERQILNYLKCSRTKLGLLINFGTPSLEFKRFVL